MDSKRCSSCSNELAEGIPFCPHCGAKQVRLSPEEYDKDPFEILQISQGAEIEVIEAAYRSLAKKYHPDVKYVLTINSNYAHASVEALRAEAHYQLISHVLEDKKPKDFKEKDKEAGRKLNALYFAGMSLVNDNSNNEDHVWEGLLKYHNLPENISRKKLLEKGPYKYFRSISRAVKRELNNEG